MLIKQVVLDRIAAGEIDTLFRRQKRPTVKAGGTLRTAVGMLDIVSIEPIEPEHITRRDARRAGYDTVGELVSELTRKREGAFYRVRVRHAGADPRIALRDDADLTSDDLADVTKRLQRLDRRAPGGPWTTAFLTLIADRPHVRAPDLAASANWETAPFKANVRKLKALGLTISHSPGYELSARGKVVLARVVGLD
jgi:hypothetical protein